MARLAALLLVLPLLVGCGTAPDPWQGQTGSIRVITSFAPIYSFAKNVAGDRAALICLCSNIGPHDYQFNHEDSLKVRDADFLLTNGLGLDDGFTDKLARGGKNANLRYIKVAEQIQSTLLKASADRSHGLHDPHLWLGIDQAKAMVSHIRDALIEADPSHESEYRENTTAYLKELDDLHTYGRERLEKLKSPIITFHESLTYFGDSFGLKIAGSVRVSPKVEADGKRLQELIQRCVEEKIRIITIEPQYPPSAAKTIQDELAKKAELKDVVLVKVDPLETCKLEELDAEWYVRKMKENINNLAEHAK